jgi:bacterioferritin-associated ferredoxin
MIVCMCNRITDAKIRAAIAAGAKTPTDVFRILHVQRACGQCLEAIGYLLDTAEKTKLSA